MATVAPVYLKTPPTSHHLVLRLGIVRWLSASANQIFAKWVKQDRNNLQILALIVTCFFQLRLDFSTFVITGPSTDTNSLQLATAGVALAGGGKILTTMTQCLSDTFSVTNPGGQSPPVICGTNTGEHSKEHMKKSLLVYIHRHNMFRFSVCGCIWNVQWSYIQPGNSNCNQAMGY